MKRETTDDGLMRDEIIHLPLSSIDPDPEQPRLDVDAELAESIKQHGVLQAIQVRPHPGDAERWMIVDGERRYRGSVAAKAATIPATITLEVEDVGDRIIRQIVRNEGKPLTAVEEALAFKKIIEAKQAAGDKKFGVVQLARELGIAKSTIGDRLALTEIPAFWLEPITSGPLQASQAPILHRWRKVPEKYQRIAFEQMKKDLRWPGAEQYSKGKKGERIYNRDLETLIRTYFPKFVKPVSDVPGYDGPIEKMKLEHGYGARGPLVYAMDPSKWGPIWRKGIAARKAKQAKKSGGSSSGGGYDYAAAEARRQKQEEREAKEWAEALPAKLALVKVAIGQLAPEQRVELMLHVRDDARALADQYMSRGDDLLGWMLFAQVADPVGDRWGKHQWPRIAKQLGIAPAKKEKPAKGKKAAAPDPADTEGGVTLEEFATRGMRAQAAVDAVLEEVGA